jgi:hypothetical protein
MTGRSGALLVALLSAHITIVALNLGGLFSPAPAGPPCDAERPRGPLDVAVREMPADATVAFVTPGDDQYLWRYFAASYVLYPRPVWWVRPGPCRRGMTWCIETALTERALEDTFAATRARYVITGDVAATVLPRHEVIVCEESRCLVRLG